MNKRQDKLKVASICMNASDILEDNISNSLQWLSKGIDCDATWLLLPEMFSFMGNYDQLKDVSWTLDTPRWQVFQNLAKQNKVHLFMGSVPECSSDAGGQSKINPYPYKAFNTGFWIDGAGKLNRLYRKIHLFCLSDNLGQRTHDESEGYLPGDSLCFFEIDGWKVCYSICYDLRFPGMFEAVLNQFGPFDVLMVPSAFTYETGKAHWELLLRARAVEYQCFVIAANQTGFRSRSNNSLSSGGSLIKRSYGHSMVIDPWGTVLANTGEAEGVAIAELDLASLHAIRERLPALKNRRPDIYNSLKIK